MPAAADPRTLHDRATRGQPLTDAERATLDAWYVAQDAAEAVLLLRPQTSAADLRAAVDAAFARLADQTRRLQELSQENARLRRENAALTERLGPPAHTQAA